MSPDPDAVNPDQMEEESRESIEKVRRMVEEHEKKLKDDAEPPLFYPED
jgi:hypothetical protein